MFSRNWYLWILDKEIDLDRDKSADGKPHCIIFQKKKKSYIPKVTWKCCDRCHILNIMYSMKSTYMCIA